MWRAADDRTSRFNITVPGCFTPSYGGGGGDFGIGSKSPEETIWSNPGRVCKVPVIMGTTADEGSLFMPQVLFHAQKSSIDFDGSFIKGLLRGALGVDNSTLETALIASYGVAPAAAAASSVASSAAAALVEPNTQFAATSAAFGDWQFTCPTNRAARALSTAFASTSRSSDTVRGINEKIGSRASDTVVPPGPGVYVYTIDVTHRCNPAPTE